MKHRIAILLAFFPTIISTCLLTITTVSLPSIFHNLTPFDVVRANNLQGMYDITLSTGANETMGIGRARFGIWGYCTEAVDGNSFSACSQKLGYAYEATFIESSNTSASENKIAHINSAYTRGLLIAPIALPFTVVAFTIYVISFPTFNFVNYLFNTSAQLVALIAWLAQVAFLVHATTQIQDVYRFAEVTPGPAFWSSLLSFLLFFISSFTGVFHHRANKKLANVNEAGKVA